MRGVKRRSKEERSTTEMHSSELVVTVIADEQRLAILIEAYSSRIMKLGCFAMTIRKTPV